MATRTQGLILRFFNFFVFTLIDPCMITHRGVNFTLMVDFCGRVWENIKLRGNFFLRGYLLILVFLKRNQEVSQMSVASKKLFLFLDQVTISVSSSFYKMKYYMRCVRNILNSYNLVML